jgi:adenylate cyclase
MNRIGQRRVSALRYIVLGDTMVYWRRCLSSREWFWLLAPAVGAIAGLVYSQVFTVGALSAAMRGALIGAPILLYERGNVLTRWRDTIRKAATPVFVLATIGTYILMILIGNAAAGTVLHHLFGHMRTAREAMALSQSGLIYALGASALMTFILRVRDLIGPGLFTSLLLGRYHRPTREERIFLFLDVAGSTNFADRHGDLETQAYLGQIFSTLSLPVRRSNGSIDDYIGDMALVTWPMHRGVRDAACLRCVFDFAALLQQQAPTWLARFGQVPEFRAVLHCGWVVTAEIGLERHKIAYFGDVVNTTGRLESLSKNLKEQVLVSADLLGAFRTLPDHLTVENLGFHAMRGRAEPLEVSAIRLRSG